jgi:hypothetical protein
MLPQSYLEYLGPASSRVATKHEIEEQLAVVEDIYESLVEKYGEEEMASLQKRIRKIKKELAAKFTSREP